MYFWRKDHKIKLNFSPSKKTIEKIIYQSRINQMDTLVNIGLVNKFNNNKIALITGLIFNNEKIYYLTNLINTKKAKKIEILNQKNAACFIMRKKRKLESDFYLDYHKNVLKLLKSIHEKTNLVILISDDNLDVENKTKFLVKTLDGLIDMLHQEKDNQIKNNYLIEKFEKLNKLNARKNYR